jgi:hypothetical protein
LKPSLPLGLDFRVDQLCLVHLDELLGRDEAMQDIAPQLMVLRVLQVASEHQHNVFGRVIVLERQGGGDGHGHRFRQREQLVVGRKNVLDKGSVKKGDKTLRRGFGGYG